MLWSFNSSKKMPFLLERKGIHKIFGHFLIFQKIRLPELAPSSG